MRAAGLALFALAALAPDASAQEKARLDRFAATRQWISVTSLFDLNPDCSHIGYPVVRVVSHPSGGRVSIKRGRTFASYPPGSSRAACNSRNVPSVIVWYRSNRGFLGTDHFDIEIVWTNGDLWTRSVNVDVR